MNKKLSISGLVFIALCTMAATIQWYSQQPAITTLEDSMVLAVERAVPQGYRSITLASLRSYTGTNTVLVSSNVYTTNLYTTNLYSSNIFTTNLFSTNVYTTNLYSSNAFITNLYATTTYTTNLYTSNLYATNIFCTNVYTTNLYTSNIFSTNITAKNLTIQNIYADNGIFTNGITNLTLTANTIVKSDANQSLASVANAGGALTNNGTGTFGWDSTIVGSNTIQTFIDSSLTNFAATNVSGGDQVWTNDGTFFWLAGLPDPDPTGTLPGPPFFYRQDGSLYVGTNITQDIPSIDYDRIEFPYIVSMTDSNEQSSIHSILNVIDSEEYTFMSTFEHSVYGNPTNGYVSLELTSYGSDGAADQVVIAAHPSFAGTNYLIKALTNWNDLVFGVTRDGVVTANAFVVKEYAWDGPTNEINVGEWTYTANTPCAVTNIVEYASGVGNGALLSITNASSSNITFTVHSPIYIPYGETSRSYTITNGNTFFGSFRKGAHGSVFVPRGFYNP